MSERRPKLTGPIHARIEELRKAKGLTLEAIADELRIGKSAVWHWENRDARPDIRHLPKLAEMLGVSVADLIDGEKAFDSLGEMLEAAS